ncbi:DoxX family protein [Rhizobium halophytocola]|uniref:Thiosulfate dehydrogenase [quinone] large subunit n=1 Tax=Rhizobium halophytocola TaxID=735519 RepID=A0ABS4DVS7_9HYPH|nr:DoxX family protein [Rhizobium halophytocola]MBP1849787.1 thiosulfate dehydrogenase [quinone] large subunit [Rhizobium halophytocola]
MSNLDKYFLFTVRVLIGWTFLYAASHQVFNPGFSVTGFLGTAKTFHGFFSIFTGPVMAPLTTFLVSYGHLAIGLSLIFGCLVRVSAPCGAAVLFMYWMAHMDFPYISDHNNFIIDYHIIYGVVLVYLSAKSAGRYWGLDGFIAETPYFHSHPGTRKIFAA